MRVKQQLLVSDEHNDPIPKKSVSGLEDLLESDTGKKRAPRPKVTYSLLISSNGVSSLRDQLRSMPIKKGKRAELSNLRTLVALLENWQSELLPQYTLDDFLEKLESMSGKDDIRELRSRMIAGEGLPIPDGMYRPASIVSSKSKSKSQDRDPFPDFSMEDILAAERAAEEFTKSKSTQTTNTSTKSVVEEQVPDEYLDLFMKSTLNDTNDVEKENIEEKEKNDEISTGKRKKDHSQTIEKEKHTTEQKKDKLPKKKKRRLKRRRRLRKNKESDSTILLDGILSD